MDVQGRSRGSATLPHHTRRYADTCLPPTPTRVFPTGSLGEHASTAQQFRSNLSDGWRRNRARFPRENTHRTRLVLSNMGRKHTAGLDRGMAVCLDYPVEKEG